jgi:hypothetical protein
MDHYGSLSGTWQHSLHCSQERLLLLVSVSPPPRDFPTFASLSPVFYFRANFVFFFPTKNWPPKKKKKKTKEVKISEVFLFVGEIHQILDIKFQ